jgi:hypothetical protein
VETLYYNRGRLAAIAVFFLLVGLFFLCVWLEPSVAASSRRFAWLLNSGLGRYVVVPLFTGTCLALAWRSGMMALGDGKALELTRKHLRVTTLWGRKRIALLDIKAFAVERAEGYPHLVLEGEGLGIFGGSSLRVPLGVVRIATSRIPDLLEAIARQRAMASSMAAAPAAAPAIEMPTSSLQRPAFGRKGA